MSKYEPKAKTVKIHALSRAAVKIGENFYTYEAVEERELPADAEFDLEKEWGDVYDSVNCALDDQIDLMYQAIEKNRKKK